LTATAEMVLLLLEELILLWYVMLIDCWSKVEPLAVAVSPYGWLMTHCG